MAAPRTLRLRQAVVAAADRDEVVRAWQQELGLGAGFADPGVVEFGLHNAVLPVGDTFLEVVSPLEAGNRCAAERHMERHGGDCGYMAIFQVEDLGAMRSHLRAEGLRSVFDADLDDIRCTHVHPADMGAAIVSFDEATPPGSWRWAGPAWEEEVRTDVVTGLAGVHLGSDRPDQLLTRWAGTLCVEPEGRTLPLPDGTSVTVHEHDREVLTGIDLLAADGVDPRSFDLAGTRFQVLAAGTVVGHRG